MPEIKNQFTGGKMNKDVDERLVPKGEYRDAMNIQVSTSEGSDVGTIQNVLGNTPGCVSLDEDGNIVNMLTAGGFTVGSIADEKNDALYWLVSGQDFGVEDWALNNNDWTVVTHMSDSIWRQTKTNGCEAVLVDRYGFSQLTSLTTNTDFLTSISPEALQELEIGWTVMGVNSDGTTSNVATITGIDEGMSESVFYQSTPSPSPTSFVQVGPNPNMSIGSGVLIPTYWCGDCTVPQWEQSVGNTVYITDFTGIASTMPGSQIVIMPYSANPQGFTILDAELVTWPEPLAGGPVIGIDPSITTGTGTLGVGGTLSGGTGTGILTSGTTGSGLSSGTGMGGWGGTGVGGPSSPPGTLGEELWNPGGFTLASPTSTIVSNTVTSPTLVPGLVPSLADPVLIGGLSTTSTTSSGGIVNPAAAGTGGMTVLKITLDGNLPNYGVSSNAIQTLTQPTGYFQTAGPAPHSSQYIDEFATTNIIDATISVDLGGTINIANGNLQITNPLFEWDPALGGPEVGDEVLFGKNNLINIQNSNYTISSVTPPVFPVISVPGAPQVIQTPGYITLEDGNGDLVEGWQVGGFIFGQIQSSSGIVIFGKDLTVSLSNNLDLSAGYESLLFKSKNRTLNFNHGEYITGINIIDDMLFWTDGRSEPKKINIAQSLAGTVADGSAHTRLINLDQDINYDSNILIREEHITVIKKAPKNALKVKTKGLQILQFGYTGAGHSFAVDIANPLLGTVQPNDELYILLIIDEDSPMLGYQNTWGDYTSGLSKGDILHFNDGSSSRDDQVVVGLESLSFIVPDTTFWGYVEYWKVTVISIEQGIDTVPQEWKWKVSPPGENTFKNKFIRFSHRYKYEDGEYSTFAPFTNVIFEPKDFGYDVKEAYNIGMENGITEIKLYDYNVNLPKDVISIDLLYKESDSPIIYIIDTLTSLFWTTDLKKSGFKVKPNQIRAALPSNQLLRSWDNVPRMAIGQEVSGSRLIYGNYLQNYSLQNAYIDATVNENQQRLCGGIDLRKDWYGKSLKSIRNYVFGISYLDKYGRQSPVFTNPNSEIEIPIGSSKNSNQLQVSPAGTIPDWAAYYKVFIKDVSNEYYNLAMDRLYDARDGNIWLSFPSSERNKVDEETFLILKKGVEGADPVGEKNRYKILAIENEAPTFIKTKTLNLGVVREEAVDPFGVGTAQLFTNSDAYPKEGGKTVIINKTRWDTFGLPLDDFEELEVRFSATQGTTIGVSVGHTKFFKVVSFTADSTIPDGGEYKFLLEEVIPSKYAFLSDNNNISPVDTIGIQIRRLVIEDSPEFDGRFFVKVKKDSIIDHYILQQAVNSLLIEHETIEEIPFYNLTDLQANTTNDPTTATPKTNSKGEWDDALSPTGTAIEEFWFIDGTYYHGTYTEDVLNNYWGVFGAPAIHFDNGSTTSNASFVGEDNYNKMVTSGYNKGIEPCDGTNGCDEGEGAYIYLSYGGLQNARPGGGSLHDDSSDSGSGSHLYITKTGYGIYTEDDFVDMIKYHTLQSLYSEPIGNLDSFDPPKNFGLEHWYLGSEKYNEHHKDVKGPGVFQVESRFKFAGGTQVYTIIDTPEISYHVNYTGYQETNDLYSAAVEGELLSGAISGEWEDFFDEAHQLGHPRNRRITYKIRIDKDPTSPEEIEKNEGFNPVGVGAANATTIGAMRFIEDNWVIETDQVVSENPAIWETEPKKDIDLDIFREIDGTFPLELNDNTNQVFAPINTLVTTFHIDLLGSGSLPLIQTGTIVIGWKDNIVELSISTNPTNSTPSVIIFSRADGSCVFGKFEGLHDPQQDASGDDISRFLIINKDIYKESVLLSYFNCYSFGNGVESNRIRDDFNQVFIEKGVKASSTIDKVYEEEHRKYGLIYSGLYNSSSGINNLNQFIAAENITKDVNPTYGSIQKLHARDTDLIVLCEDQILKVLSQKDAVFNADGNTNLTATENVLGQTIPFSGEFGISKNPESFASEAYRAYFTDRIRGAVMRLSKDGLTAISNHGMKDWFRDNLKLSNKLVGSYDDKKDEYNITLMKPSLIPLSQRAIGVHYHNNQTVTFKEDVKGWVSFKSFTPENAISCANEYYTFDQGNLWRHHEEGTPSSPHPRNTFYGAHGYTNYSTFTAILNDAPGSVKSFNTINYEGSQSKVNQFTTDVGTGLTDGEYHNLHDKNGWWVDSIYTNKETGSIDEFIEKEGKWFNYIKGLDIQHVGDNIFIHPNGWSSWDDSSFAIQGLGQLSSAAIVITVFGCMDDGSCTMATCGYDSGSFGLPAGTAAYNYDPTATVDNGLCDYIGNPGCADATANNYDELANPDNGTCEWYGCTDTGTFTVGSTTYNNVINATTFPAEAYNAPYNGGTVIDDGSCIATILGCTDIAASNYDPLANANTDDGSCASYIFGCTESSATTNYDPTATNDDGTCIWSGCNQPLASNYGLGGSGSWPAEALSYSISGSQYGIIDDGSCLDGGCVDASASNYDATALWDNGSCVSCDWTTGGSGYSGTPIITSTANETIAGNSDGQIAVQFDSAAPYLPYTFTLTYTADGTITSTYNTNQTIDGVVSTNSILFSGLAPGFYTVNIVGNPPANVCSYDSSMVIVGIGIAAVSGCIDPNACNYDPTANSDDGSCDLASCVGCTDPIANGNQSSGTSPYPGQYDVSYTRDCAGVIGGLDYSCCQYTIYGCVDDLTAINYIVPASPPANTTYIDDGTCTTAIPGCIDDGVTNIALYEGTYSRPTTHTGVACNYDSTANVEDGSCTYPSVVGFACNGSCATGYVADGSGGCEVEVLGCTDPTATNYDTSANSNDGTCIYPSGCTDDTAVNWDPAAITDDGSCLYGVGGCMDATATNYDTLATVDDGSCIYPGCGPSGETGPVAPSGDTYRCIPDPDFRIHLTMGGSSLTQYQFSGTNSAWVLQSDLDTVTTINVYWDYAATTSPSNHKIYNAANGPTHFGLEGIEYFTNLETLYAGRQYITELDLTSNTLLTLVNVGGCNSLGTLDVNGLQNLYHLGAPNCSLDILNVCNCPLLEHIGAHGQGSNVLGGVGMIEFYMPGDSNAPDYDGVSGPAILSGKELSVDISNNDLTTLAIPPYGASDIKKLWVNGNNLTQLDINTLYQLEDFDCSDNALTNLYVGHTYYDASGVNNFALFDASNSATSFNASNQVGGKMHVHFTNQLGNGLTNAQLVSTLTPISILTPLGILACGNNPLNFCGGYTWDIFTSSWVWAPNLT